MDRDDTVMLSVLYLATELDRICVLSIIQPTTWLPNGKPILACSDATLDRVTIIANMIKPICTPSRVAERPSSEACLEPAVEERMLFSKRIYSTPTRTIRSPPASLRDVRSAHDHGIKARKRRVFRMAYETHIRKSPKRMNVHHTDILGLDRGQKGEHAHRRAGHSPRSSEDFVVDDKVPAVEKRPECQRDKADSIYGTVKV